MKPPFVIACLFAVMLSSKPVAAQFDTQPHVIRVRADSEIKVLPDKAVIVLGVQNRDSLVSVAKQKTDIMTRKAVAIARKYGVSDNDISTEFYSVEPQYNSSDRQEFLGFWVVRRIVINLNRFESFQALMDDFLAQGVENVFNIRFKVSDQDKYIEQALADALNKAKSKAQKMAAEAGVKLGKIYSIDESYRGGIESPNEGRGYYSALEGVMIRDALGGVDSRESTTFGYLNATASVTVSFEIE